jgi:hypothetical protein
MSHLICAKWLQMAQSCNRAWLGMAALVFASSAGPMGLPSAHAQDAPPTPEAVAPEEPQEITSADFAIEANAVEDRESRPRCRCSMSRRA